MLCGCGKAETVTPDAPTSEPVTTAPTKVPTEIPTNTPIPTNIPTPTPTDIPAPTETPTPTEIDFSSAKCAICGSDDYLYEYATSVWNEELGRESRRVYFLCTDCYLKMKKFETDEETFKYVYEIAQIALADEEVYTETQSRDAGYIIIDKNGISYENLGSKYIANLEYYFKYILGDDFGVTVYTNQKYVLCEDKAYITVASRPESPLAKYN